MTGVPTTPTTVDPSGTALLQIELGVIWRLDEQGRLPGPESMVIGVTADGLIAAVSHTLPTPLAQALLTLATTPTPQPPGKAASETALATPPGTVTETTSKTTSGAAFGAVPDVLEACRALLGGDSVTVSGGPSYLVTPPIRYDVPVDVLRSDEPAHAALVRPLRAEGWDPDEWDELVGGGEGAPWAMIVENGEVAALCHTARLTPAGAEAGTWTAPAYRGRGYAAATTAVWAGMLPGIRLFYSTSADNHSSQRVAQRLALRPLGWFWKLTA